MQPSGESLGYYLKHYARYVIPTWLFPVYFIGFGLIGTHFKVHSMGALSLVFVIPVFFIVFSLAFAQSVPFWKKFVLMMVIPFAIAVCLGIALALIQLAIQGLATGV